MSEEEQSNKTIRKNQRLEKKVAKNLNKKDFPPQIKEEMMKYLLNEAASKSADPLEAFAQLSMNPKQVVHEGLSFFAERFVSFCS